jgi:hypothetical protein
MMRFILLVSEGKKAHGDNIAGCTALLQHNVCAKLRMKGTV